MGLVTNNEGVKYYYMDQFAKKTNITLVFGLSAWYGREANNKAMNFSTAVNSIKYANT